MRKVLVTGGSGYIGSHTILSFIEQGITEIISVDDYSNSSEDVYTKIEEITGVKVHYYGISVLSDAFYKIFEEHKNIDAIIHFAAYKSVPESTEFPAMYMHNNLGSLTQVMLMCEKYRIPVLVFSSSCSVYGNIQTVQVDENTPLSHPESPYAFTKRKGEEILAEWVKYYKGTKVVNLRYFNPAGAYKNGLLGEQPGNRPANLVPIICKAAKTGGELQIFGSDYNTKDGTCIRDYIHVSDIADAHVAACKYTIENRESLVFDTFNLGSETGTTVLEAVAAFEAASGIKLKYNLAPRRAGDVAAIFSNSEKANKVLGWKAKRSLEEIMLSAWNWSKNHY